MTRKVSLLLVALISCPAVSLAQEPASGQVDFNFTYQPGSVSALRMTNRSVGALKMPDPIPEQKFSQTVSQVMTMKCLSVNPDKSAEFEMTMSDMAMDMSIGGLTIKAGGPKGAAAASPKLNVVTKMLDRMIEAMNGAKLKMTLSRSGEPLKVSGLSEFIDKLMKAMADENTPPEMRQTMKEMAKTFSDDSMKDQMNSCYRMLPGVTGPHRIGEKWERNWTQKMPFGNNSMEGKGQYELLGTEQYRGHPCAKIRLKETFEMKPGAPTAAKSGGGIFDKMNMTISGTGGEGLAYVDYASGQLVQLRQTQNLTINIEFKAPMGGTGTQPAAMPPAMTQKLRNSLLVDLVEPGAPAAEAVETSAPAAK
jgi:hypothetical protein